MPTTGFIVYYLFGVVGLIPDVAVEQAGEGVTILGFEPVTILNVLFLLIGAGFLALLASGRKGAPGDRVVEDPVTGTDITVKSADYCTVHDESIYYFETEDTRAQFRESPEAHL